MKQEFVSTKCQCVNLPDTIFGEKVHYWSTRSIAECREHADNFVVIFATVDEYKRVTGELAATGRGIRRPVAAWYNDGEFDGWNEFGADFETVLDYETDFKPYTFFVYRPKAQII